MKKSKSQQSKKRKPNANICLTKADVRKLKSDITAKATMYATILFMAYIMEDPGVDCNEDKLCEIFEGVQRYMEAVDDHLITIRQVCDIIKNHTGLDIQY